MAFKGEVLREWRKARRQTQAELAAELGIVQTYLSEIETGAKSPGFGLVEDVARLTGISIGELSDCGNPMIPRKVAARRSLARVSGAA